ncbi:chain length determinant protein EpsF [Ideonella sp. A 288]|uniref:chain length determinant protein EpsF n=1 Tax=Ideonella sp. A 288 TaxID=1962181 RepID=UPI000B4B7B11|nr:chain length determinant protein EpsF [Ideonella sp. A 288]
MLLTRLLLVLRARWALGLGVAALVTGLAAAVTALLPRAYSSSAAVVLDVKSPDPVAGLLLPGMALSGYMATQVDILQSERVATKAAAYLDAGQQAHFQARWQQQAHEGVDQAAWLAGQLLAAIEAKPGRESNVLTVVATTPEPGLSSAVANAFVRAFIDTTLELKVEPAKLYNNFFDQQSRTLRAELDKAQARLTDFQRDSGITAGDERIDVENAKLAELATQFIGLQGASSDTQSRVGQATASPDRMQEVLGNGVVSGLKSDLARQEARLDELLARLGEQHPQVLELRANVEQLRHRIDQETRRLVGGIGVSHAVNSARLEQARLALQSQRARVVQLREQRDHLSVLAKDVDNAQRAYDAVYSRQSQTSVESQLTQTNVSVLKTATPQPRPASPRRTLNLALGAALGLLLGVVACLWREALHPVLRTEDDVLDGLQLPLLEWLPALPHGRGRAHGGRSLDGLALAQRIVQH